MTGNLRNLDDSRTALKDRQRVAAGHPALRWVVVGGSPYAHRRGPDAAAACGEEGELDLAPSGTARCPECHPDSVDCARPTHDFAKGGVVVAPTSGWPVS